jgi:hypothetical protein
VPRGHEGGRRSQVPTWRGPRALARPSCTGIHSVAAIFRLARRKRTIAECRTALSNTTVERLQFRLIVSIGRLSRYTGCRWMSLTHDTVRTCAAGVATIAPGMTVVRQRRIWQKRCRCLRLSRPNFDRNNWKSNKVSYLLLGRCRWALQWRHNSTTLGCLHIFAAGLTLLYLLNSHRLNLNPLSLDGLDTLDAARTDAIARYQMLHYTFNYLFQCWYRICHYWHECRLYYSKRAANCDRRPTGVFSFSSDVICQNQPTGRSVVAFIRKKIVFDRKWPQLQLECLPGVQIKTW